jgi:aminoglycoside 3-N-acetyltransferase
LSPIKKKIIRRKNKIKRERLKKNGKQISRNDLINFYNQIGIEKGDTLFVHSSLRNLGYILNGAEEIISSLVEFIDCKESGTLMMPSFPNQVFGYDYLKENKFFDVNKTPSKMGVITEFFRQKFDCFRSYHPTHPVIAFGKKAKFYTSNHHKDITPFSKNSPFYKITQNQGKILLLGVKYDTLTSFHLLEDAVEDFIFKIYADEIFNIEILDNKPIYMKTKAHNPKFSLLRRCNDLEYLFEESGSVRTAFLGDCKCYLIDASKMYDAMIKAYHENFVTMYTPFGISKNQKIDELFN